MSYTKFAYHAGWAQGALESVLSGISDYRPGGTPTGPDTPSTPGTPDTPDTPSTPDSPNDVDTGAGRYEATILTEEDLSNAYTPADYAPDSEKGSYGPIDELLGWGADKDDTTPRVGSIDLPVLGAVDRFVDEHYKIQVTDPAGDGEQVENDINKVEVTTYRFEDYKTDEDGNIVPLGAPTATTETLIPGIDVDVFSHGDSAYITGLDSIIDEAGGYQVSVDLYEAKNADPIAQTGLQDLGVYEELGWKDAIFEGVSKYDAAMGGKPGTLDDAFVKDAELSKHQWLEQGEGHTRLRQRMPLGGDVWKRHSLAHATGAAIEHGASNLFGRVKNAMAGGR